MTFVTIATLADSAKIRILITALKAHGFNPLESGQEGIVAMPGVRGIKGVYEIRVPKKEAREAEILAKDLIRQMQDKNN